MKDIVIKGASENNLKNVNVVIPRDRFVVITGISGSGKSTLAFDTIYAEGQRRYVESLSAYARQFLGQMNKPKVDSIEGLSPAISIDQKTTSKNPRSTVGTVTEIYDYLRLLYSRIGTPYCPIHNKKIKSRTPENLADKIQKENKNKVLVLSPIIRQKKGTYERLLHELNKEGYTRARVDKKIIRTEENKGFSLKNLLKLDKYKKHDIEAVIGKVDINDRARLVEAIEEASSKSKGLVMIVNEEGKEKTYSLKLACPVCGISYEELEPRMFSFNSPFGACEECHGLGTSMEFEPDLIIPDKSLSIADGAIRLYRNAVNGWRGQYLGTIAKEHNFTLFTPINKLSEKQYKTLMYGSEKKMEFNMVMKGGDRSWSSTSKWEGLIPQSERLFKQTKSEYRRKELKKYMRISECPACRGKRLKDKILSVKIEDKSIQDVASMNIRDCKKFFENLKLNNKKKIIAQEVLKEIKSRLKFLSTVGLNYLTLDRSSGTLSGGEAQRIRLATQIGSNLMGVLYILDEPSIGLHQKDNERLIGTLKHLRDLGNTVLVVEHDEETIRASDYILDMGRGAGRFGGEIIAQGELKEIMNNKNSLTGQYLNRELVIEVPGERRKPKSYISLKGCKENNLKNINPKIPLGVLAMVSGVSGSGKSTLVHEILYKSLKNKVYNSKVISGEYESMKIDSLIDKVIIIDQSPIGKTPRSNPATYTKVFDYVRKLFSETKEAKIRGYTPGRFSFNLNGGRCENCRGDGLIKIEMNFLPDVYIKCEECKGKRYNKETLQVKYKGKTISDVLEMTVEEAREFFKNVPVIKRKLDTLIKVGLDYLSLGQNSVTLSGGEAQRIKITRELSKKSTGNTIYLLDEPTTGLHFHDIKKLIKVLNELVEKNNSVIVIEHNLDVLKSADYIIDLGPEGGDKGGEIIATGTPEEIAKEKNSFTGRFLKKIL